MEIFLFPTIFAAKRLQLARKQSLVHFRPERIPEGVQIGGPDLLHM